MAAISLIDRIKILFTGSLKCLSSTKKYQAVSTRRWLVFWDKKEKYFMVFDSENKNVPALEKVTVSDDWTPNHSASMGGLVSVTFEVKCILVDEKPI